jgi:hypothetical protein
VNRADEQRVLLHCPLQLVLALTGDALNRIGGVRRVPPRCQAIVLAAQRRLELSWRTTSSVLSTKFRIPSVLIPASEMPWRVQNVSTTEVESSGFERTAVHAWELSSY